MKSQKKNAGAVEQAPTATPAPRAVHLDPFERLVAAWPEWMPFRSLLPTVEWGGDQMLRVDEFRRDGDLVVRAEIPGIDPAKDVDVSVSDGMLTIRAERHEETKDEQRGEPGYVRRELRYGSFYRSLPMPRGVRESDVTATYTNGILEITVPSPTVEEARKIEITAG